jgi:type IV pilus assembly protein PilV
MLQLKRAPMHLLPSAEPLSMPMRARLASRAVGRGFSLIEVLVSIFIVSLGILALAGLLQSATRYGKMSEVRSTATLLGNDIADHVRANLDGAAAGAYDVTTAFPAGGPLDRRTVAGDQCLDPNNPCSSQEIAAVDIYNWKNRLFITLPKGTPYIHYNTAGAASGSSDSIDIWVAWLDPGTTGSSDRPSGECPPGLQVDGTPGVRCIYMQVGMAIR